MHGSCFEKWQWPYPICKISWISWFDFGYKLTFEPHIKYLKVRSQEPLNILKVLSRTEWGADRTTLLKLYRSLVRSKLDYGCIVYGSASITALAKLDPVHNQGLRLSKNPLVNRVLQTCQENYLTVKSLHFVGFQATEISQEMKMLIVLQKMLYQKHNLHILNYHVQMVFFIKIQPFVSSLWQKRWDKEVGNKLHAIMPQIDDKYYSGCTNRKDDVIINRLRIGHTRLTHSFRMENRPHFPLCDQCEGDHELTETYFDWMQFPEDHSSTTLWCDWYKSAL